LIKRGEQAVLDQEGLELSSKKVKEGLNGVMLIGEGPWSKTQRIVQVMQAEL
jgi:hypothetical protein